MFEERGDTWLFWVLFAVLIFETCCEKYDCYNLSSGKDICFTFDDTKRTFEESKQICQDNGRFLLEIYNHEMQNFVEDFRSKKDLAFIWLNLRRKSSNKWVWGDDESDISLNYNNWESGSPQNGGMDKAYMNSNQKWMNGFDQQLKATICIKGNRESFLSISGSRAPSSSPSSPSSVGIGVGIGVGLGVMVLIIVSSLLVAKFVFHKEIPLPFKSSRRKPSSSSSPPHQTGSDVIKGVPVNDDYEQIDDNKIGTTQNSNSRTTYAEVVTIEASDESQPTRKSYYNINNNNCNNNNNSNNNNSNNNNNKALDYVEVECSNQSNFNQEPERVATPDGTLYTKTFQKI